MNWAYGVTTTPMRFAGLLPQSLGSLARAGFDRPHLFVDGCDDPAPYRQKFGLLVTPRPSPGVGNFGNWWSSMIELYCRNPKADRYVMFEDDVLCCQNLRQFLEQTELPDGYWNLFTFPQNERVAPPKHRGWFPSNQRGLGAQGLMFDQKSIMDLLHAPLMVHHPLTSRGTKRIDGVITDAMHATGRIEHCHYPSLMQHVGIASSIPGNPRQPPAKSFPGEDFDCLSLLSAEVAA